MGEDGAELIGWISVNMCKPIFHWPVKIEGYTSMCVQFKERGKIEGKTCPWGAKGSIELHVHINSSLCFGKNSQCSLFSNFPKVLEKHLQTNGRLKTKCMVF